MGSKMILFELREQKEKEGIEKKEVEKMRLEQAIQEKYEIMNVNKKKQKEYLKEIEKIEENWMNIEVTVEELEKGDDLIRIMTIEEKMKEIHDRIQEKEEKEEKERKTILPQRNSKELKTLQQQLQQLTKRKNELNKIIMNCLPVFIHPKQSVLSKFIQETQPAYLPLFLVSLPITIHNTEYYQAINTVLQPFFKNIVVVKDRKVTLSCIR